MATTTPIVIKLDDGTTEPMTPPAELGAAFAAVIAEVLTWDDARRAASEDLWEAWLPDDPNAHMEWDERGDQVTVDLHDAGLGWSCAFGDPDPDGDARPESGPYVDTLRDHKMYAVAYVAEAVLARDLGLIARDTFDYLTAWWVAAGLPLPDPRPGYAFAADAIEIKARARHLYHTRYDVAGWPMAPVTG